MTVIDLTNVPATQKVAIANPDGTTPLNVVLVASGGMPDSYGAGVVDAGTQRMTQASDSPLVTGLGAVADAAVTNPALSASLIAATKGVLTKLALFVFGAGTAAAALRVVVATDQTSLKVVGTGAADAALTGNPVLIAGRDNTFTNATIPVIDAASGGWRSSLYFAGTAVGLPGDANGLVAKPYSIAANDWKYAAATGGISNTTTAVTIKAAAGASIKNYITCLQLSSDPLGAATELAIRDGAAGTVLWRMKIGTAGIVNGLTVNFPTPLVGTANTLLEVITLSTSLTGGVFVNAQGFTAA